MMPETFTLTSYDLGDDDDCLPLRDLEKPALMVAGWLHGMDHRGQLDCPPGLRLQIWACDEDDSGFIVAIGDDATGQTGAYVSSSYVDLHDLSDGDRNVYDREDPETVADVLVQLLVIADGLVPLARKLWPVPRHWVRVAPAGGHVLVGPSGDVLLWLHDPGSWHLARFHADRLNEGGELTFAEPVPETEHYAAPTGRQPRECWSVGR